ncbi:plastocyanin/azurin family copper-binding protein [Halorubellus salinus]|uniref:plastocyanin/azurin family copper-binding protein n=1 Tax=Halorubellus salinus TaxID=755309 RepID=UPI001D07751B|nr:plastocyanin/azurin family copper-binding protein [Halorubellus salinus]
MCGRGFDHRATHQEDASAEDGDVDTTTGGGSTTDDAAANTDETGTNTEEESTTTSDDEVAVEVAVGPDGEFGFEPAEVDVDPGDTVRWTWQSDNHNVVPHDVPAESDWVGTTDGEVYDSGFAYEHTFEVEGRYDYHCEPHRSVGMTGRVVVGDVDATTSDRVVLGEDAPARVVVGPEGEFVFEPGTNVAPVVRPGTEVRFVWGSDNHSLTVDERPDGATWTGTEGALHDAGVEHVHTFETEGRYRYHCEPHESVGMVGELVVASE